jgi:aminopeptidase N
MPSAGDDPGRSSILDVVSYDVAVDITHGAERFWSRAEVRFGCRQAGAVTFADLHAVGIRRAALNDTGLDLTESWRGDRLELPRLADDNVLVVEAEFAYAAAAEGLHHVTDTGDGSACVYSKTSSHGAPRIFCCFDQQDLRSAFTVSIQAPAGWSCVANGPVVARPPEGEAGVWRFAPTAPIPPWLSGFCAGTLSGPALICERGRRDPVPVTIQRAASTAALPEPSRILDLLRQSLRHYERTLGVPYPYGKCDLVFVPALPVLAFSVPGLIVIQDQVLTQGGLAGSAPHMAAVIAHELAHAWTGGLVTMRGREQMWLDEALTTYISRAALADILPGITPWAPSTSAALPDHDYAADAAAVRQLEDLIGRPAVAAGLGTLLRRHAPGSATKDDLVRYWSQASGQDLRGWAAKTLIPTNVKESEPGQ